ARIRPFSSAAAFSVNVTAQSFAGGSGSAPPRRSTQMATSRCVLPVPAPAWITALLPAARSSGTGHLAAVFLGVGGQRHQPADGLQVAVVAAQRADREIPGAHPRYPLLDCRGQRKSGRIDAVVAQPGRAPG